MSAKFPRIPHLPWSPGTSSDDERLSSAGRFADVPIVVTEKMDGSNLCMTRSEVFARTHAHAPTHPSFDMAKALHAQIRRLLGENLSLFGEWCYAKHSIFYTRLPGYFLLHGVRDDKNGRWFSWDDVLRWAESLGIPTVPELWRSHGESEKGLQTLTEALASQPSSCGDEGREGVVVRISTFFNSPEFPSSVAKWVREGHVRTDERWRDQPIVRNLLRQEGGHA